MNIYKHELKVNIKSTIMWTCVLSGITILFMFIYSPIKNDLDNFLEIMDNIPKDMKAILGLAVQNLESPIGFYAFAFAYISLLGAIQAMNFGIGIVSKEERERTADFLITKPVSRVNILTSKILAVFTLLIITNVVFSAVSAILMAGLSLQTFEYKKFLLIDISLFLSQIIFFLIGLIVSIVMKKIKTVLPFSLGFVFMFYAISAFIITSNDDKIRFLTPFQYFRTDYILASAKYEIGYIITSAFIVVASLVFSYILYKRKDIHAV